MQEKTETTTFETFPCAALGLAASKQPVIHAFGTPPSILKGRSRLRFEVNEETFCPYFLFNGFKHK